MVIIRFSIDTQGDECATVHIEQLVTNSWFFTSFLLRTNINIYIKKSHWMTCEKTWKNEKRLTGRRGTMKCASSGGDARASLFSRGESSGENSSAQTVRTSDKTLTMVTVGRKNGPRQMGFSPLFVAKGSLTVMDASRNWVIVEYYQTKKLGIDAICQLTCVIVAVKYSRPSLSPTPTNIF